MSEIKRPVYLDYQATTPLDPRVLEVMMPYFMEKFGNPHSTNHVFGWEAAAGVEHARGQVAALIGAQPEEIIFTSGATESNNLALKGLAYSLYPEKDHIITVQTEHSCVLASCAALERAGFEVTYLTVNDQGLIDLDQLTSSITSRTSLVSIMAVNNEIGIIQDLQQIGEICAARDVAFHTDAAQAVGKIPLNVDGSRIDLLSISAHKCYGPMGIGALYLRKSPKLNPLPLIDGGGQERGLRSGTLPAPLCVGLGTACAIAGRDMTADNKRIAGLSERLKTAILNELPDVQLNGPESCRIAGNLNFTFKGVRVDQLIRSMRDLALSTGSACSTEKVAPSHVLTALGLNKGQIAASLRIGIGRMTTQDEIDYAIGRLTEAVTLARSTP